jgi:hypothetical protein
MAASNRAAITVTGVAGALVAACTFSGLGDYTICAYPTPTQIAGVGTVVSPTDLTMVSGTEVSPVAAYVTADGCLAAVDEASGYVTSSSCSLLSSGTGLVAQQPYVVNINGGEGVFVTTGTGSGPCPGGEVAFTNQLLTGQAPSAVLGGPCVKNSVSALPSYAALPGGANGVAAWYQTSIVERSDPLGSCAGATAAPLVYAVLSSAASSNPAFDTPVSLATDGVSVRPPAILPLESTGGAVLAAPTGGGVGIWTFDSTGLVGSSPPSVIAGMEGAKAVAMATDGAEHLAVVAEIGCSPQSITLSVGTASGNFTTVAEVAPAGTDAAFQPTVAWVSTRSDWLVTWISRTGGSHVLARRFSAAGVAEDAVVDPAIPASVAAADASGQVFAFDATTGQFETADLKCVP